MFPTAGPGTLPGAGTRGRNDGTVLPVRVQSAQDRQATENRDMEKSPDAPVK